MKIKRTIVVGTRKSLLAMAQAEEVVGNLRKFFPACRFLVRGIITSGDRLKEEIIVEGKGVFVKEIEESLIAKKIDLAVHSLKDLPCELPVSLEIAAVTRRVDFSDVLISREKKKIDALAFGSSIGTSSLRRKVQLSVYRPDLRVKDIRGNLDTRLRKLKEGRYDAIVVAAAGIIRLGLKKEISQVIPAEIMLPAPGQGCLGIEVRKDDDEIKDMVGKIDHQKSRLEANAERAFLRGMGGGCRMPIAALAKIEKGLLRIEGMSVANNGIFPIRSTLADKPEFSEETGKRLAEKIKAMLKQARVTK